MLLELKNIKKHFFETKALDGVDFQVQPGEVHAIIGENGAGKSTLIKIIAGIYAPDEGEILINGRKVEISSPHEAQEFGTHVLQSAPRHLVSRVTPLTTAAQQVMVSFAVAGMTGFLTSRITDHMTEIANPMEATVSAYGDTFLLAAGIALAGALLGTILSRPKQQPEHVPDDETKDANVAMPTGH